MPEKFGKSRCSKSYSDPLGDYVASMIACVGAAGWLAVAMVAGGVVASGARDTFAAHLVDAILAPTILLICAGYAFCRARNAKVVVTERGVDIYNWRGLIVRQVYWQKIIGLMYTEMEGVIYIHRLYLLVAERDTKASRVMIANALGGGGSLHNLAEKIVHVRNLQRIEERTVIIPSVHRTVWRIRADRSPPGRTPISGWFPPSR